MTKNQLREALLAEQRKRCENQPLSIVIEILVHILALQGAILVNQQETLDALNSANTLLAKIATEEQGLSDAVTALTAQLANQQNTPEVDAALATLQASVAKLDAIVPDAPAA